MKFRHLQNSVLFAAIVYVAAATLPPLPKATRTGLGPSWCLGLNLAHANGLVHGKDLVWTYGPLGYLECPDATTTDLGDLVVYRLVARGLLVAAVTRLVILLGPSLASLWFVFTLGGIALLNSYWTPELELPLVAVTSLVLVERTKWRYVELGVLACLAGAATMVKVNLGVQAIGLFVCAAAIAAFHRRPISARQTGINRLD